MNAGAMEMGNGMGMGMGMPQGGMGGGYMMMPPQQPPMMMGPPPMMDAELAQDELSVSVCSAPFWRVLRYSVSEFTLGIIHREIFFFTFRSSIRN